MRVSTYLKISILTLAMCFTTYRASHSADIIISTPTVASQTLAATDNITITNAGSINAPGNAISISAAVAGFVDNSGLVSGASAGVLSGFGGDFTGGVLNRAGATIDSPFWGIAVGLGADISGGVDNNGVISGGTEGIYVTLTSDISGGVINQSGSTITGAAGIRVEAASTLSGGIFNSGTIEGTGGVAMDFAGLTGQISITLNGGRVIGDIFDDTPANNFSPVTVTGNFGTEGNIDVSSLSVNAGRRLTINSGNTVTLDNMPASAGGMLVFGVDNAGPGGAGQLVVNGAGQGLNLSGLSISIAASGGPLAGGDEILIGDGLAAITGGPGGMRTIVQDNSFAWNFEIADGTAATAPTDASDLFLFVLPGSTCSGSATTTGNVNACNTMLALDPSPDPMLQQAISNMNSAPNDASLNEVLESVQPAVDGGAVVASLNTLDTSLNLVTRWLDESHKRWKNGVSSGNGSSSLRGWGQAFGSYATQDTRDAINGYDAATAGFAMGVDAGSETGRVVGVAVSYGWTQVNSDNANTTETDINSYQATVYGELELGQDSFVRAMGAYVRSDVETERHNVGGGGGPTAQGDYSANQYNLRAVAGRGIMINQQATVTPSLLAHWTHYDASDYSETGAGGASLTVRPEAMNILELGLGVDVNWNIPNRDGSRFTPEITAGYRYDFAGDRVETTSVFTGGGAAFNSLGPEPARHRMNLGASMTYVSAEDWNVTGAYDLDYKAGYYALAVRVKSAVKF